MTCLYGDLGMHSLSDGSQIRISLAADEEMVSWQARLVLACQMFLAVSETGQLVDTVGDPLGYPELTIRSEGRAYRSIARAFVLDVFANWCASAS